MIVYLDNASTTKPCEAAVAASLDALTVHYGNPSSAHTMGEDAGRIVKEARFAVARVIGARPEQIVFTGGGTESDALALHSVYKNPKRAPGSRLFISAVEHPAVREPAARLAELGVALSFIPVDGNGVADVAALEAALDEAFGRAAIEVERALISVMHVNNELGVIQPVAEIARVKARFAQRTGAEIVLHTDAVQSYGKLPIDLSSAEGPGGFAGVDLLTCSAHKAYGPKGVGALYAAAPERLAPLIRGGGQERGLRSGTENTPGIAGFGAAALECLAADRRDAAERAASLRARLLRGIKDSLPDVRVNSPEEASVEGEAGYCSPYLLNVSFPGTRGEVILHDLEQRGVFVSTGSACSNIARKKQNPVLEAAGLTPKEAGAAIRFSLSRYNTEEEIDYALEQVKDAVTRFRRIGTMG
jgi:cysteine desulfurase